MNLREMLKKLDCMTEKELKDNLSFLSEKISSLNESNNDEKSSLTKEYNLTLKTLQHKYHPCQEDWWD